MVPTRIIFLRAHPRAIVYNCIKFHQYWFIHLGGVALTRNMDRETVISINTSQNIDCWWYKYWCKLDLPHKVDCLLCFYLYLCNMFMIWHSYEMIHLSLLVSFQVSSKKNELSQKKWIPLKTFTPLLNKISIKST